MKKILIITAIVVVAAAGVAYRWVQTMRMGGGQSLVSPDGKLAALAFDLHEKGFWGGERDYYEFHVRPKDEMHSGADIKFLRMDNMPGTLPFPMRSGKNVISWADDSKSVTFAFQGIELRMSLDRGAEDDAEGRAP